MVKIKSIINLPDRVIKHSLMKMFFFLSLLLMLNVCSAQKYYMGIGGRAGKFHTGVSFKTFFNADNATGLQLDLLYANVASGGYTLKGMIIKQLPFKLPIVQLPLDFIYGGGAHAGYFPFEPQGYYKRDKKQANYYDDDVITIGVDVTAQIEYKIHRVPVTIGIEVVPFYEFINPGPEFVDVGVSIRYVFK
jgi:hypothetical protein